MAIATTRRLSTPAIAGREVTETVMQVYGGIGQTGEHVAHLYTRRAVFNAELLGNAKHHLAVIADERLP